jgi:hypothetical protein
MRTDAVWLQHRRRKPELEWRQRLVCHRNGIDQPRRRDERRCFIAAMLVQLDRRQNALEALREIADDSPGNGASLNARLARRSGHDAISAQRRRHQCHRDHLPGSIHAVALQYAIGRVGQADAKNSDQYYAAPGRMFWAVSPIAGAACPAMEAMKLTLETGIVAAAFAVRPPPLA